MLTETLQKIQSHPHSWVQLCSSGWDAVWWGNLRKRLMTAASQSEGISGWCGGWLKFILCGLWCPGSEHELSVAFVAHAFSLCISGGSGLRTLSRVWWYWAAACHLSCAGSFNHDISTGPELCNKSAKQRAPDDRMTSVSKADGWQSDYHLLARNILHVTSLMRNWQFLSFRMMQ